MRKVALSGIAAVLLLGASAVSWQLGLLVLLLEVAAYSAWKRKLKLSGFFGPFPKDARLWKYYLTTGLAAQASLMGLATLSLGLEVYLFPAIGAFILGNDPGGLLDHLGVAIGLGVITMPIIEECLFRGVLFRLLRHRLGFWPGLILSSLLFGCAHADPVGDSVFGAVLALAYARTGGLAIPICLHMAANALALAADQLVGSPETGHAVLADFYGKPAMMTGAVLFLAGLPFLVHFVRRDWPRETPP